MADCNSSGVWIVNSSSLDNLKEKLEENSRSKRILTNTTCTIYFSQNLPPHIPSSLPFLGCAIEFGKSPIEFLLKAHAKYGSVFSFTMMGKTFTYLIGSDSSAIFFNSRNDDLNAEEVYSRLVTPVFGKGVCYDVPHDVWTTIIILQYICFIRYFWSKRKC